MKTLKTFEKPEAYIVKVSVKDIIATSGPYVGLGSPAEDGWTSDAPERNIWEE